MSAYSRRSADFTVLVYSDDPNTRQKLQLAIGRRPAPDVGTVDYLECSTIEEAVAAVDAGKVDLLLLDGEAQPTGGMGISRQLKNEIENCPPTCVVVARSMDRWLAAWSQADATLSHPLDPINASGVVADLLRARMPVT
ncbi:MAG: hypothetical protein HOQ05_04185 [Corynebacteriales bacterium]|nr:hypothetical protein [Mycobacteriales bacterium]